jgi:hypothetical protein
MHTDDESVGRSALAIAERLGDHQLRCTVLRNVAYSALLARDFDRACTLTDEVMALLPGLPNPDVCSTALMSAVFVYMKSGRLGAAARASVRAAEAAATPHHRVHAAGWQLILASVTGRWDEVRARAAEAERARHGRRPVASGLVRAAQDPAGPGPAPDRRARRTRVA